MFKSSFSWLAAGLTAAALFAACDDDDTVDLVDTSVKTDAGDASTTDAATTDAGDGSTTDAAITDAESDSSADATSDSATDEDAASTECPKDHGCAQKCELSEEGQPVCSCDKEGFILSEDNKSCECDEANGYIEAADDANNTICRSPCKEKQCADKCEINEQLQAVCSCTEENAVLNEDGKTCDKPCETAGCAQKCSLNESGAPVCSCDQENYILAPDQKACITYLAKGDACTVSENNEDSEGENTKGDAKEDNEETVVSECPDNYNCVQNFCQFDLAKPDKTYVVTYAQVSEPAAAAEMLNVVLGMAIEQEWIHLVVEPGGYTQDGHYRWNIGNGKNNAGTYSFSHKLPIQNFDGYWYGSPDDSSEPHWFQDGTLTWKILIPQNSGKPNECHINFTVNVNLEFFITQRVVEGGTQTILQGNAIGYLRQEDAQKVKIVFQGNDWALMDLLEGAPLTVDTDDNGIPDAYKLELTFEAEYKEFLDTNPARESNVTFTECGTTPESGK